MRSRHHFSFCNFKFSYDKKNTPNKDKQGRNKPTILILNKADTALLQTATAFVFNKENCNREKTMRILFDYGRQKSSIMLLVTQ